MSGDDQKLEVIRKLLAKAERAATPDEAAAYNAKAAELMARHGVDEALLAATGEKPDRLGERRVVLSDPYSAEKAQLASWIGRALGCSAVHHLGGRRGQVRAVTLIGFESDLRRSEMLFTSLLLQATRQVVRQRPPSWTRESTTAFRRTWLVGFANAIHQRLAAAEQAAAKAHDDAVAHDGQSVALVLADRRSMVEKAFGERFPDLVPGRRRRLSGSGYSAGASAGRRADLGGQRLAGRRRQIGRQPG